MISVCIITKNECDNLDVCLSRLAPYGFELVVIDTGSTDDTKKIAAKYTSHIYDFEWCDDFAAARNFAISKASNDYILMIDTDEFITSLDLEKLKQLIRSHPDQVGRIHRKNYFVNDNKEMTSNEMIARFFPKSLYHYEGRIHEQVVYIDNTETAIPTYEAPIYIDHVGYTGDLESHKAKSLRNIHILLAELDEKGEDPYILYQLGKSYYYMQDYPSAISYFNKALELPLDLKLEYVNNMIVLFGYSLLNLKLFQDAMMLEGVYDDFSRNADFLFVMALIYMNNGRFNEAVQTFLQATTIPSCSVEGVNSSLAFYNVGVIYECLEDKAHALSYYKKAGNYSPALEGIKRCS